MCSQSFECSLDPHPGNRGCFWPLSTKCGTNPSSSSFTRPAAPGGNLLGGNGQEWEQWALFHLALPDLAGDNSAIVKSMFSALPCNFGGKHFCILSPLGSSPVGLGTSPKSSPQGGKPWLHLLEGKTWPCPGKSCSQVPALGLLLTPQQGQGLWLLGLPRSLGLLSPAPGTSSPPPRPFGWRVLCWGVSCPPACSQRHISLSLWGPFR